MSLMLPRFISYSFFISILIYIIFINLYTLYILYREVKYFEDSRFF